MRAFDRHAVFPKESSLRHYNVFVYATQMNYTRWILDLQTALNENDTEKWVTTVGLMLDIPRVIDEVKNSATSKASCLACKFLVNLVRSMFTTNKTDEDILNLGTQICTVLNIQTSRVCSGVMQLFGVSFIDFLFKFVSWCRGCFSYIEF